MKRNAKASRRKEKAELHEPKVQVPPPYEPTEHERRTLTAHFAKRGEEPPLPALVVLKDGTVTVDHPEPAVGVIILARALGTSQAMFFSMIVDPLVKAATANGTVDHLALNSLVAFVASMRPRDELEAALATQMAITHLLTATMGRRLLRAEMLAQSDSAERAFNKLARTFTTQIEALKRYRTGGEQKVTVKHVTVNSGGQAIVGNVTHGGAPAEPALTGTATITAGDEQPLPGLLALPPEAIVTEGGGGALKSGN
jgi:hypothetical protein